MRKSLVLALVALFALGASALAEEAPSLSVGGSLTLKAEEDLKAAGIDFSGSVDTAKLSLKASQGDLWSLSVALGSIAGSDLFVGQTVTLGGKNVDAVEQLDFTGGPSPDYYKDKDGNYWTLGGQKLTAAEKAGVDRRAKVEDVEWQRLGAPDFVSPSVIGAKFGAYTLAANPGPAKLTVWGNDAETSDKADLFGFVSSGKSATDPKFRVETSLLGPSVTLDYDTADGDAAYVFGTMDVAGIGTVGAALQDTDVKDSNSGLGASVDVKAPLGLLTVKGGLAFDFQAGSGNDSLAFGVGAEATPMDPVKLSVSFTNDGRGKASTAHTQVISGSVGYGELATVSVKSTTTGQNDKATLEASVEASYSPVDRVTLKGSFSYASDEDSPLDVSDPSTYTWVDPDALSIADILSGITKTSLSLDYKVSDKVTLSPSFEVANYSFKVTGPGSFGFQYDASATAVTGSSTSVGVTAKYSLSDKASASVGIKSARAEEVKSGSNTVLPSVDTLGLTTTLSVSF